MLFKIRSQISDTIFSGAYIGEEQKMFFGRQNSGDTHENFTLYSGTVVEMEFDATRDEPAVGSVLDVNGHFVDFTKKSTPEPVFCVTKINSVI